MAVIEHLRSKRDFTPSEIELADYILEHADSASRMGIAELAAAAYKSNATIIRLCRKVGSAGWRDFRVDFVADLERERRRARAVDPNAPFAGTPATTDIMNSIAALEREAIDDCYATVNPAAIEAFARAACASRRILYYALGDSYTTLYSFGGLMSKIGVECVAADQYRFRHEASFHATSSDVALIVTYTGDYLPELERQIRRLRERRCKIAVITSAARVDSPLAGFDFPIVLPRRENRFRKVATFYSQTCIRYVLNCVYSVAFSQDYDTNLAEKDLMEKLEPDLTGEASHRDHVRR